MSTESRGRGRPRNPVVQVSLTLTGAEKRDVKGLQVKAHKLGGTVHSKTGSAMVVRFGRKTAGMSAANFERAAKSVKVVTEAKKVTLNPYTMQPVTK